MHRPARKPRRDGSRREVPRAPAGGYASGLPTFAALPQEDRELEHELEQVVRALREEREMSRPELRDELNARLWGPGRLRYVLRTAEEEGVVRRSGRDRYSLERG